MKYDPEERNNIASKSSSKVIKRRDKIFAQETNRKNLNYIKIIFSENTLRFTTETIKMAGSNQ